MMYSIKWNATEIYHLFCSKVKMKDSSAHQNFKWSMKIVKFVTYTCTFIGPIAIPVGVSNGLDLGPNCLQNFNISR